MGTFNSHVGGHQGRRERKPPDPHGGLVPGFLKVRDTLSLPASKHFFGESSVENY